MKEIRSLCLRAQYSGSVPILYGFYMLYILRNSGWSLGLPVRPEISFGI